MAVQQIMGKTIIRTNKDVYRGSEENVTESNSSNIYGEYFPKKEKNIDVAELAELLSNKLNFQNSKKIKALDIDIQREISISNVDKNAVKSEVTIGKVNNKLDKLKALRKNGS
jgi:hypothetical protein